MTDLAQIPLFDESQLPAGRELLLPDEEQRQRFTGEQVKRNAARYQAIVSALAEGLGIRQICRAFEVSQHTVEGIRDREATLIATEKERHLGIAKRLARATGERLLEWVEESDKPDAKTLAIVYGIAADKMVLLSGQATQTIAVRHEVDQDQVRAMFERMAAAASTPGPVVDVESSPAHESASGAKAAIPDKTGTSSAACGTDVVNSTLPNAPTPSDPAP